MKLKSTNLARGVFAWFCFLLCAFSIIAGLIFAIYYGRSIFDEGSYFFTEIGQALSAIPPRIQMRLPTKMQTKMP